MSVRENTTSIMEAVDEGWLDAKTVLLAALLYMLDDEVGDMARINEFIVEKEE